jgi:hypothetical protein
MAGAGEPGAAELRVKYDATTRLLALQCDTIERLHLQVQALQQHTSTTCEGKENKNNGNSNSNSNGSSSCGGAASDAGGFEPKYRRAKRLVTMQVRV